MIKSILSKENDWCDFMKIYNPYSDPWNVKLSSHIPNFDAQAYNKYKAHNFVYDKLFISRSQGVKCGILEDVDDIQTYPIFIKPRYGNKSASSKHCYKINSYKEVTSYLHIPDMMWSEYLNATEGMTDYFIQNGRIVHQITYVYSETQHGTIADDWKFISIYNTPPTIVDIWVRKHMMGYTGVCNVQYRGDKIIEVGLRLARGGAYIYSTNNEVLIKSINSLVEDNSWNVPPRLLDFKPFYAFKCYTFIPIVYLYPQYVMDSIMKWYKCEPFYEYYFEPSGKGMSMTTFQFIHNDFDKGMYLKKIIENLFNITHILLYMIIIYLILYPTNIVIRSIILIFFLSKLLNPLGVHYSLYKAQKQSLFG
jgi:hypothetical protein